MAYGLQLAGCRNFLVEQFSGISAGYRAIQLLATDRAKSGLSSQVETWQKLYVRCVYETRRDSNIPDFIWQQQGDGEVFVGSWADSFFGVRPPLQLLAELFDDYQGNQSAMIAALPGLRPGATINHGERITSVALVDNQMAIRWTTQSSAA